MLSESRHPLSFSIKTGLTHKVTPLSIPVFDDFELRFPRSLQSGALRSWLNSRFSVGAMPMGSGKSLAALFKVRDTLEANNQLRCIIAVSQTPIAKGFKGVFKDRKTGKTKGCRLYRQAINEESLKRDAKAYIASLDKTQYTEWAVGHDKTKSDSDQIVNSIKQILEDGPGTTLQSRIILCTHAALVKLFRKLQRDGETDVLRDLFIVIDEAHHISEDKDHGLGDFCNLVYSIYEANNLSMLLLTATPFRGDRRRMIPQEWDHLYKKYVVPFDEYMKQMTHLKSFDFQFGCFRTNGSLREPVEQVLQDKTYKHTLFFIPRRHPGAHHPFSSKEKKKNVDSIVEGIARSFGWKGPVKTRTKVIDGIEEDGIYEVQVSSDTWKTVIDLVDNKGEVRKNVKNRLDDLNENPDFADYIIALEIGKEGFDWVWCDQVVIFGKVGSLTQLTQIVGRPIRDILGKEKARIVQFFPCLGGDLTEKQQDQVKDELNGVFNAVSLAMLMYEVLEPITVSIKDPKNENDSERIAGADIISDIFAQEADRDKFFVKVNDEIYAAQRSNKGDITDDERKEILRQVMSEMGVSNETIERYLGPLTKYIKKRNSRIVTNLLPSMFPSEYLKEAEALGFRNVHDLPPEAMITMWGASQVGFKKLSEYHRVADGCRLRETERLKLAEGVRDFCLTHNRKPRENSLDPEEAKLGDFLARERVRPCHRHERRNRDEAKKAC